jgi:hypothetical protein
MLLIQKQILDQGHLNFHVVSVQKRSHGNIKQFAVIVVDVWYHIKCQGIHSNAYRFLDESNISWECIQCGMPNLLTSIFNSTYSIELEN